MTAARLVAAVPELDRYQPQSGIGRVLHNLSLHWDGRVHLARAQFDASRLPLLRNAPYRVCSPAEADLVFLPKMTGAGALRDTRSIPSVVIVHDIGIVDYPPDGEALGWPARQVILHSFRGLRHASFIVAVSEFTRRRLVQHLPEVAPKVGVIPNSIAPAFLNYLASKEEARAALAASFVGLAGIASGEPLLLAVGSETPRKNMPLLLQVLRATKGRYPRARLLKVGSAGGRAWRERTLAAARANGLQPGRDIFVLEDVSDATLAAAYRAADVYVSTSLYEGFGLPAAEALAIGTPVVVTNRAAFPETVDGAGRVVEPEVSAFVDAVCQALVDPDANDRIRRGKALASAMSVADAANRYFDVMEQVVHAA